MTLAVAERHARSTTVKDIVFADTIHIPPSITDLDSFREWCRSAAYPERADVFWFDGVIWADMHTDELVYNNLVKTEFTRIIGNVVKDTRLGYLYSDRARLVQPSAGLSVEPDALFVSKASLADSTIRLIPGNEGFVELEGAADMVLEVVSRSSETKDTVVLREKYWAAGVKEYWLR